MMNDYVFNLYWSIAQMGLGMAGVLYDLSPLNAVRFAQEGNSTP